MASARKAIPRLPPEVASKRTPAGWAVFASAARAVLERYDLLRVAVVEEWGGRSSRGACGLPRARRGERRAPCAALRRGVARRRASPRLT